MARKGLTGELVALAGAELADEAGFEQVTPSAVARRVGVQVASLYAHVRNADDLRARVTLLALAEMADRAAPALAGRAGRDALIALGSTYRDYAREHPGRYKAAQARLDHETALAGAGPRHAEMIRAILRGYDLPETEQTHAVRLIGSAFHGYITQESGGAFDHSRPGAAESWTRVLDALDAALRHWPHKG